jgi:acetyl-CoA synthetase
VAQAAALLDAAGSATLTEREAKAVLAAYGVPVVGERLVGDADAAAAAAKALGFPVVLKVESPDIPHKTEAGAIRLGLRDAGAVREGHAAIMANAASAVPDARINGVLVEPMVPQGLEIVVGARRDPLFGQMVVVGLGGIFVELLRDSATALAPVGDDEARAMLRRLKGHRLLDGFRGMPAVDQDALVDVIRRVSELAADHRDRIAEIDVNPLICAGDRILAVDGLIVRG